ncbi:MAG: hypothetical protein RLZZ516_512 [Cyanobacteriota bacterium]|jgi:hypothetical protein
MDSDKLYESVKFLLRSVRQLSDRFVENNDKLARSFEAVREDINDLAQRLAAIEQDLQAFRDRELLAGEPAVRPISLPVPVGQEELTIPALNLPLEGLLDAYRSSPALLQPFARPCSVSGRSLSGELKEVELEAFAQGSTWMIELQDGSWQLLPRPGVLSRPTQLQSLERFFEISGSPELPAELELLQPAVATSVEHGRRWMLTARGHIGLQSDPLQRSLEQRLSALERALALVQQQQS